jgi:hypothetical protein
MSKETIAKNIKQKRYVCEYLMNQQVGFRFFNRLLLLCVYFIIIII